MTVPMKTTPHNVVPDYIRHGWQLCVIPQGTKGPEYSGWNLPDHALKSAEDVPDGYGVGLLHSYSGTCAVDLDQVDLARAWLAARGVDLDALLDAPDAVQIISGRPNSGKLIYRVPLGMPIPSKKVVVDKSTVIEFRCASVSGLSVQDLIPPSRHPSGTTYQWGGAGDWRALPVLPEGILKVWNDLCSAEVREGQLPATPASLSEIESALMAIGSDCSREKWIEVMFALEEACRSAGAPEAGLQLFDEWSATSESKYPGPKEVAYQWKTAKDKPNGITAGTLFHHAFAAGWNRPPPDVSGMFQPIRGVQLIKASGVKPEHVDWLWKGWLAKGKIHIAAGAPGTGKTTIALRLAATVSAGGTFPDGEKVEAGNVLIWSGEDAIADTLVPRLMAAGANMERVFFVSDIKQGDESVSFDPAVHMQHLEAVAKRLGNVSMLIVDSIADAVAGDSHKNAEVRRGLRPLADFGQQTSCAIFGIAHFNKGSGGKDPLERVMGSAAFGAIARIVYGCAKIVEGGVLLRRVFARAKSNIGPDGDGFEYSIQVVMVGDGIEASRVEFGLPITGTAREILGSPDEGGGNPDEGQKATNAMNFLREILKDGPVDSNVIKAQGKDEFGITVATMRRAKDKLGIRAHQIRPRVWEWSLPPEIPPFSEVK